MGFEEYIKDIVAPWNPTEEEWQEALSTFYTQMLGDLLASGYQGRVTLPMGGVAELTKRGVHWVKLPG